MGDVIAYESGKGLYINLTNRCPCDCEFCIRKKSEGINAQESLWLTKDPSYNEVIEAIDEKGIDNYEELVFCGFGEPTERLDILLEVAKYIKEKRPVYPIRINTNGLSDLVNGRSTASEFSGLIDSVSISLNATCKEDYLRVCHPKFGIESYDALKQFAVKCKDYVRDVCFTVIDSLSDNDIRECQRVCDELGIRLRVRSSL